MHPFHVIFKVDGSVEILGTLVAVVVDAHVFGLLMHLHILGRGALIFT